jgi:large subunit ribosomal protein L29
MSEVLKYEDIKDWDAATIDSKVSELRKNLFSLNMKKTTVGLDTPHVLKVIKKNIARLLTAKSMKVK